MPVNNASFTIPDAGVSDVAAGSFAVAFVIAQVSITPPSGWTADRSGTRGGFTYWIGHKVLVDTDLGALQTWTFASPSVASCIFTILNGVTGIDRSSFAQTGTGGASTITAPSVNPVGSTDLLLCIYLVNANVIINLPTDLTSEVVAGSCQLSFAMGSRVLTSGAATGTETANWNGAADAVATQIAFRGTPAPILENVWAVSEN